MVVVTVAVTVLVAGHSTPVARRHGATTSSRAARRPGRSGPTCRPSIRSCPDRRPVGKTKFAALGRHRQEVAGAEELGHELRRRLVVDTLGRTEVLVLAAVHDRDPVAERHGLVLVVRDVRKVMPTSRWMRFSSTCMVLRIFASRAPIGSSSNRTFGWFTSARASATRCC